ncbi:phosphoribosylaminoimidazole carboxylase ATPase subunit [Lentisphaera araneosa HTCC2155]|uniref:N5-carboxyaminoimidazole ribonucleotide synthase n=1 Tax=Lentisphaera araneosa HTCC2155 TaxID=313628 RepID=A6DT42_9BACT|nr:5-(carboxyamino)imidazole ribonucleotide synthase [Lentisphaera araneosa]EDM25217.1 phosphoribosylaminoimidazole carboxylase ATPase subunit [Lentisphaera araneosa HTCC2155]
MKTIGIIGGGQLGRMMTQAAKKMGFHVIVLDPGENSPAGQVADSQILGSWNDSESLKKIVEACDVCTYDLEHVDTSALIELSDQGHEIHPDPRVLSVIQDKLLQKQCIEEAGLSTPAFIELTEDADFAKFGFPLVQKTRKGGYDGKGVLVMKDESALVEKLPGECMLEKMVDLEMELGVMVARGIDGELVSYPVTEMTFDDRSNILDLCIVPARISADLEVKARTLAEKTIEALGGVGIYGVEMFVDKQGEVFVNEVAPRPHNSGHYTIEACVTSQYEQHIRAVAGLPLGSPEQMRPCVMYNLLGEPGHTGEPVLDGLEVCLHIPGVSLHMYGKAETRGFRKMGHVTVTSENLDEALEKALIVKKNLKVISE